LPLEASIAVSSEVAPSWQARASTHRSRKQVKMSPSASAILHIRVVNFLEIHYSARFLASRSLSYLPSTFCSSRLIGCWCTRGVRLVYMVLLSRPYAQDTVKPGLCFGMAYFWTCLSRVGTNTRPPSKKLRSTTWDKGGVLPHKYHPHLQNHRMYNTISAGSAPVCNEHTASFAVAVAAVNALHV